MSLIDEFMVTCAFMNKSKVTDGEGGWTTVWTEGVKFNAAIVIEDSTLAIVAESQQEKRTYKVTTSKQNKLEKGDVIKRMTDSATFKITSESEDVQTPASSLLDMAQCTAERWNLTS